MKESLKDGVMVTQGQADGSDVITFFAVAILLLAIVFVILENRNKPLK